MLAFQQTRRLRSLELLGDASARRWKSAVWSVGFCLFGFLPSVGWSQAVWTKHVVCQGFPTTTAVAGDYTGDGRPDVITNGQGKTRLYAAPDWREVILEGDRDISCIHSETMDVDGDGDLDFVGARYQPGLVFWLEQPKQGGQQPWTYRVVNDQIDGIHGLLRADVDDDGRDELIANSAQPNPPFPNSAVWLKPPASFLRQTEWARHVFAKGDADGLSHYFGVGDLNGDGRLDIALAAKGGPQAASGAGAWFAWWEAPRDRTAPWKKHLAVADQLGATNILPADINADGKLDLVVSRGHDRGVFWLEAPAWTPHAIHAEIKEPHSLIAADLDQDGDIDAATCAFGDRQAFWYQNDGKGGFVKHLIANDQAAYDLRAVDMDGDSDLDLLIAGQASQNVVWLQNPVR